MLVKVQASVDLSKEDSNSSSAYYIATNAGMQVVATSSRRRPVQSLSYLCARARPSSHQQLE